MMINNFRQENDSINIIFFSYTEKCYVSDKQRPEKTTENCQN